MQEPLKDERLGRRRRSHELTLGQELLLAALPTATVLAVLALLEAYANERILYPSLASSAFLVYLDPTHATNQARVLSLSHLAAAVIGALALFLLGPGYAAAGIAMAGIVFAMVVADLVHPPAVSTALAFAFRPNDENSLPLFAVAVGMVVALVILQRAAVAALARMRRH